MITLIIVSGALFSYAVFWIWYVGLGRRISTQQIEQTMQLLGSAEFSSTKQAQLRHFLENDDGKDFVMVNLLNLKQPRKESALLLNRYSKIFLGRLLKRAGHPIAMARAASGYLEALNVDEANPWQLAVMVRYRSRRDFAEVAIETLGSDHHADKLAALEMTFAFPAAPWFVTGGLRWLVALVLALLAALLHIILV